MREREREKERDELNIKKWEKMARTFFGLGFRNPKFKKEKKKKKGRLVDTTLCV